MRELLRRIRDLIPRMKQLDDRKYHEFLLEHLRFTVTSLHDPWHAENPWAYGLHHGQIYVPLKYDESNKRFFRAVLEFEKEDFDRWKRAAIEIPRDRFLDAFAVPVRYRWMIGEMEWTETHGTTGGAVPGSRRPLDRDVYLALSRCDGIDRQIDGDANMD